MAKSTKSRRTNPGALLLALALSCALFFAQGVAMSEAEPTTPPLRRILEITATARPAELVAPGEIEITFSIANSSAYDADNLTIATSDGLHTEPLGQLAAGKSQTYPRDYTVSQQELDAGQIVFIISHDDIAADGTPVNYTVTIPIEKSEARPELEFTRQISAREVVEGATITVTYRVKNTGNVALTQLRVRDSLGDYSEPVDSLAPGATEILSQRVTVGRSTSSSARVSYVAADVDDKTRTVELTDVPIQVVEEGLTASLALLDGGSAVLGDMVSGVLSITAGGADVSAIAVTDDVYGTVIADSLELKSGESLTIMCSWPVRAPSDFRLRVTGVSATGDALEVLSNTATVALTGEFAESALSVSATAATPAISRAGKVRFTVTIANTGNASARDVTLSVDSEGTIRTFAFIPTGDPTFRDVLLDVDKDEQFVFSVRYEDESGNPVTVSSAPVAVRISSDGAHPELAQEQDGGFADWISRSIDDSLTYVWMLAIAGLMLIVLTVILIVSHFRERRARRQKQEQEKQRRREELGKTAKFEPVKRPVKPEKKRATDALREDKKARPAGENKPAPPEK